MPMYQSTNRKICIILMSFCLLILLSNSIIAESSIYEYSIETIVTNYIEIEVTADKEVYVYGEKVTLTIRNLDSRAATGVCRLNIFLKNESGYFQVHKAIPSELNVTSLEPNSNFTYTWNQKDEKNIQVLGGTYFIEVYFVHCHGIQASDSTEIIIQGPVHIERISGGYGFTVTIRNIGDTTLDNIKWVIEVDALLILQGKNVEGVIETLNSDEQAVIKARSLGFGIGLITVCIDHERLTADFFIIGEYVLII